MGLLQQGILSTVGSLFHGSSNSLPSVGNKNNNGGIPAADPGGGYPGGGYGYGGGGGGGGGGSTTTKSTETNKQKNTTTTKNTGDVTTVNDTGTDANAQKNLLANARGQLDNLTYLNSQNEDLLNRQMANNDAVAQQQHLENDRSANNSWYQMQQKLQNVSGALRADEGNGVYGSSDMSLNGLLRRYDDIQDQTILGNQRKTANEINQTLYSSNANAVNDYNESLLANQQEAYDIVQEYLSDYNQLLGNKTTQQKITDETVKNVDNQNTKTKSTTKSESTGDGSKSTVTTDVTATHDVTNNTTGNNKVNTQIASYISPYLDKEGNLDYGKISQALGYKVSSKGVDKLGGFIEPDKLQQQNNYRTPRDTVAALTRRYG